MRVELVTIGDELLLGQTIDTNSSWMAQQLNLAGVRIKRITTVADRRDDILEILEESGKRSDVIIMTGGLGPTSDDVTKPVLCEYFGSSLTFNAGIYEHIQTLLSSRGCELNERNRKQAEVPENAVILHNAQGTAPGLWMEKNGSIFISLPGVPFEMKSLVTDKVMPKLKERFKFPRIFYKTIITQGGFESQMAEILKDFESELPDNISLAYLPSPGIIRLRVGTTGNSDGNPEQEVEKQVNRIREIIPDLIVGFDDDSLESLIGNMLKINHQSLSVAESCTGGTIASMLTSVPGSSEYFKGGIVAYSNEIKRDQLAIDRSLLENYGAVSKQVVEDMALNTRLLFNTDYSVSVSGIAGPGGGSGEKPVGTTWIAVSGKNGTFSEQYLFGDNRERNIKRASITALNMLRKLIISDNKLLDSIKAN